jgi:hypothetical protein
VSVIANKAVGAKCENHVLLDCVSGYEGFYLFISYLTSEYRTWMLDLICSQSVDIQDLALPCPAVLYDKCTCLVFNLE